MATRYRLVVCEGLTAAASGATRLFSLAEWSPSSTAALSTRHMHFLSRSQRHASQLSAVAGQPQVWQLSEPARWPSVSQAAAAVATLHRMLSTMHVGDTDAAHLQLGSTTRIVAQLRQPLQRGAGEAAASMDERRRLETLEKWDVRNSQ